MTHIRITTTYEKQWPISESLLLMRNNDPYQNHYYLWETMTHIRITTTYEKQWPISESLLLMRNNDPHQNHYYVWETMTHIRMILKYLCFCGMLDIIQSYQNNLILRIYFATLVMFYVVKIRPILMLQGSHRNSKTQFHDFSMIFHDQRCNFHDYLMHGLPPLVLAASSPRWA